MGFNICGLIEMETDGMNRKKHTKWLVDEKRKSENSCYVVFQLQSPARLAFQFKFDSMRMQNSPSRIFQKAFTYHLCLETRERRFQRIYFYELWRTVEEGNSRIECISIPIICWVITFTHIHGMELLSTQRRAKCYVVVDFFVITTGCEKIFNKVAWIKFFIWNFDF